SIAVEMKAGEGKRNEEDRRSLSDLPKRARRTVSATKACTPILALVKHQQKSLLHRKEAARRIRGLADSELAQTKSVTNQGVFQTLMETSEQRTSCGNIDKGLSEKPKSEEYQALLLDHPRLWFEKPTTINPAALLPDDNLQVLIPNCHEMKDETRPPDLTKTDSMMEVLFRI
ncbi:hypothetical protein STEG23_001325, partial [Scotinomys teguina]